MKPIRTLSAILFFLLLVSGSGGLLSREVGRVTRLQGKADVIRKNQKALFLKKKDPVYQKDVIRTKSNSLLEITMQDNSTLILADNARMEIEHYATGEQPEGVVSLGRGKLRAFVTEAFSKKSESFKVKTPTAIAGVQGTEFIVSVHARFTRILVFKGSVVVSNANPAIRGRQVVSAGEQTIVTVGEPPAKPFPFEWKPGEDPQAQSGGAGNRDGSSGMNPGLESVTPERPLEDFPSSGNLPPTLDLPPVQETTPGGTSPPDSPNNSHHGKGPKIEPPGLSKPVEEHPSPNIPPGLSKTK